MTHAGAPQDDVDARLDAIEREHGVRVLYACESGSRAWGFASTDSDYDVRFVYVHDLDGYLSVDTQSLRDVIELPIDGLWDVDGWDLRKALHLLSKSNPPLLEWLSSPIVYRKDRAFFDRMVAEAQAHYAPKSCLLHYLSMANANHREYLRGDQVWRKKYFYLLRPLFACRWIEQGRGRVPMEFDVLLDASGIDAALRRDVEQLMAEKRAGEELGRGTCIASIDAFVDTERARLKALTRDVPRSPRQDLSSLDRLFRDVVLRRDL